MAADKVVQTSIESFESGTAVYTALAEKEQKLGAKMYDHKKEIERLRGKREGVRKLISQQQKCLKGVYHATPVTREESDEEKDDSESE